MSKLTLMDILLLRTQLVLETRTAKKSKQNYSQSTREDTMNPNIPPPPQ